MFEEVTAETPQTGRKKLKSKGKSNSNKITLHKKWITRLSTCFRGGGKKGCADTPLKPLQQRKGRGWRKPRAHTARQHRSSLQLPGVPRPGRPHLRTSPHEGNPTHAPPRPRARRKPRACPLRVLTCLSPPPASARSRRGSSGRRASPLRGTGGELRAYTRKEKVLENGAAARQQQGERGQLQTGPRSRTSSGFSGRTRRSCWLRSRPTPHSRLGAGKGRVSLSCSPAKPHEHPLLACKIISPGGCPRALFLGLGTNTDLVAVGLSPYSGSTRLSSHQSVTSPGGLGRPGATSRPGQEERRAGTLSPEDLLCLRTQPVPAEGLRRRPRL